MEGRHITCPHCRERLPNEVIVTNQEASDALLADPGFQRRIRAVRITVLFIKNILNEYYVASIKTTTDENDKKKIEPKQKHL